MGKYTSKVTALKVTALALAGLLLPSLAWAAGLGKLTVLSALGQPLRAEIEVSSLEPGEADSLVARLAGAEAYRQANIERQGALTTIRFAVDRRPSGQYAVVMTSVEPMNEPFLDLLVELNWNNGRLVREYTFLLDPPEYKTPVVIAPAPPVVAPQAPVARPAPTVKEAAEVRAPEPVTERALAPATKSAVTYEVKRGDTLAKIAIQNKQQGVSLQQMLVALYRGNQDAFDGNNMNRLRAGKILNVPERESAAGVPQEDAQRVVAAQGADYAGYRRQIGAAVAQAPARAERGRQVTGQIGALREEKPAPAAEPTKDQLRLSKADDAKAAGRTGSSARADDLAAKEKALKEANERIALLEKNVQDLQKLALLKSEAGAQMQQAAKGAPAKAAPEPAAKPAVAPATKAEPPKPAAPEPAPKAAADSAKAAPAPGTKAEEAAAVPVKSAEPANAAETPKATEAKSEAAKAAPPKAAPKAAPPPPPDPSFADELLDNPMALGAAGGVVILLAGYAAYAWRRKRKAQFESSLMGTASALESPSVFGASGGQQIDTGAASFQSDFSQGGISKIDSEEIDPIAEADVYMAYGRDAQAEEILREALGKDSSRHAIRAKLLEIYANRKDLKAFETTASELYAATSGQGPEWDKAVSLGLSIDPQNPLYGGAAAQPGTLAAGDTQVLTQAELAAAASAPMDMATDSGAQAAPPLDFDLDLGASTGEPSSQPDTASDAVETAPAELAPTTLDFDLGFGDDAAAGAPTAAPVEPAAEQAQKQEVEPAPVDEGISIDFDLGLITDEPTAPAPEPATAETAAEPAAAPAEEAGFVMDFDLGSPTETATVEQQAPELDLSAISLDLGTSPADAMGAAAPDAHWQEVATKLDLAKAYEEMGDKDGARELLNEVAAEGDPAQQQQAKTMLQALG